MYNFCILINKMLSMHADVCMECFKVNTFHYFKSDTINNFAHVDCLKKKDFILQSLFGITYILRYSYSRQQPAYTNNVEFKQPQQILSTRIHLNFFGPERNLYKTIYLETTSCHFIIALFHPLAAHT